MPKKDKSAEAEDAQAAAPAVPPRKVSYPGVPEVLSDAQMEWQRLHNPDYNALLPILEERNAEWHRHERLAAQAKKAEALVAEAQAAEAAEEEAEAGAAPAKEPPTEIEEAAKAEHAQSVAALKEAEAKTEEGGKA